MKSEQATPVSTFAEKQQRELWAQRAIALSWFTIVYNFLEGIVSMWFGIADESFALFGFGADSFIEVASAILVLWRFRRETGRTAAANVARERRATIGIGVLFALLAVATASGGALQLWNRAHPETTLPGLLISLLSLSFMFFLWKAKLKVADKLSSSAMRSDASCSLACIKLSTILFAGSLLYLLAPTLWWADACAALVLSCFIGREGFEIISSVRKGEEAACCGCK